MPNFPEAALVRVGQLLNPGRPTGHLARLAECAGTTRKAIQNWSAEPDEKQFRAMSGTAKRCIALLAYFAMTGKLTREVMEDVIALQEALEDEARFADIAARVSQIIREYDDGEVEQG